MTHEFFISYSAKDAEIAEAVCQTLEKDGLSCWIAPRDITPGVKFAEAILDGINQCRIFLLILSATSNNSPQVEMEVDRAASKNITILSFRIDSVLLSKSMEYYLSSRHWLDASTPPLEGHLLTLVETAKRLLGFPMNTLGLVQPAEAVSRPLQKASTRPTLAPNPFTFGNPIQEPERFFGRRQELRQILNRLLSSAHESTSILGERRIGKTSLLLHLAHPKVAESLGLTPDKFCLVYVDFQGLTDITTQRFWQRVLGKMSLSVCDRSMQIACQKLSQQAEFDLFDLEDLFESFSNKSLTTVLLMDEFEYVTQNPNFTGDFFGGLRSLAIHHRVALIPATRRELVELCYSNEIKGSPFFNIFVNVVLRPFTRQETDELLAGYTHDRFTSAEKDFIWNLGGGYPQFFQTAGYYLLEGKTKGLTGNALEVYTTGNFDQQADSHYSYLWSHCSESEKITLLIILTLAQQNPSKKTIPNLENISRIRARVPQDLSVLSKRALIYDIDGSFHIFSPSFEKWIRNEILVIPGEQESQGNVEQWLKSHGRENLKEARKLLPQIKKRYWITMSELLRDFSIGFTAVGVFEIIKFAIGIR